MVAPVHRAEAAPRPGCWKGIDLRRFRTRSPDSAPARFVGALLFSLLAIRLIARLAGEGDFVVQYQSVYSSIPAVFAKLLGKRVIGDDIIPANPVLDALALRFSDLVITPSPATFGRCSRAGRRAVYLPNGLAPPFPPPKDLERAPPRVVFVGSMSYRENLTAVGDMLEVLASLDPKVPYSAVVVGGPLSRVARFAGCKPVREGRVEFAGAVPDSRLREVYGQSRVGLLPFFGSRPFSGGQRIKALEFFAHGLLVISSPQGVKGIDVRPGAHYLAAGTIEEMRSALQDSLVDPKKYSQVASLGRMRVIERHSWERLGRRYLGALHEVVGPGKGGRLG